MKAACILSLALATALTAGCRRDDRSASATPAPNGSGAVGTSGAANDISSTDKNFVKDIATANLAELDMARTAVQHASTPDVKKFAQMMITDHTKAGDTLESLARQNRIEMPASLDEDHREKGQKLAAKKGMDFDRDYAEMMVD